MRFAPLLALVIAGAPLPHGCAAWAQTPLQVVAEPRVASLSGLPGRGLSESLADRVGDYSELAQMARTAVDAGMAEQILSAAAAIPAEPPLRTMSAARDSADHRIIVPTGRVPGQTIDHLGSAAGVALAWQREIDRSMTLSNAFRLSHAGGPIETQLVLVGRVSVLQGGPMALSYRSSTNIELLPNFTVGADAQGPLGTLSAFRPGVAGRTIEPHVKLALPGLDAVAAASTGWREPLVQGSDGDPARRTEFHWKLSFKKKL